MKINVPKKDEASPTADTLTVIGARENVEEAREALRRLLEDLEKRNFSVELVGGEAEGELRLAELIPQLRARNGAEAERLAKKHDVRLDFSKKGETPDRIVIRGPQDKVEAVATLLRKRLEEDAAKTAQEIAVDARVHSRIIGGQGKALAKIQERFKVEIKFAGRNSDVVVVRGNDAEAVEDACDHLKNLEEEYLQVTGPFTSVPPFKQDFY